MDSTVLREELDDHREAINENANELASLHEYVQSVEKKVDLLLQRFDAIEQVLNIKKTDCIYPITALNPKEKEVFFALYSKTETAPFVCYKDLSRALSMSESLVAGYVTNIMEKGIPVVKKYSKGKVYLKLKEDFREIQARENVVGVNSLLRCWF